MMIQKVVKFINTWITVYDVEFIIQREINILRTHVEKISRFGSKVIYIPVNEN